MNLQTNSFYEPLHEIGVILGNHELLPWTSGNISRKENDSFIISNSCVPCGISWFSTSKVMITAEEASEYVSGEWKAHRNIYQSRNDIQYVAHIQSAHIVHATIRKYDIYDLSVIPEIPYYIKNLINFEEYYHPCSDDLAKAIGTAFAEKANVVLCPFHGAFVGARDVKVLISRCVFLNLACKIKHILNSQNAVIPSKQIHELIERRIK